MSPGIDGGLIRLIGSFHLLHLKQGSMYATQVLDQLLIVHAGTTAFGECDDESVC